MNAACILLPCVALAAGGAADVLITKSTIANRDVGMAPAWPNQDLQWQARLSATTGESGISSNT